jgi:4-amino-4-deoxychorismate lyase
MILPPDHPTRFIETIGVAPDGTMPLAPYHLSRLSETLTEEMLRPPGVTVREVPVGLRSEVELLTLFRENRPAEMAEQYKLRIVYSREGIDDITVTPYHYDIRRLRRVWLYDLPKRFDYHRKYLDRSLFEEIASDLPDRETVVLLLREDCVTDTTFTNVCFRHAETGIWETPDTPLLAGTRRASYLRGGEIRETHITLDDLRSDRYDALTLINALNPLGKVVLPVTAIDPIVRH